ncbi:MAG: hypothetical protein HC853_05365 [Anaerolineae bacterium]|nr:hypothetical protein [Anaerolineae bacterium]
MNRTQWIGFPSLALTLLLSACVVQPPSAVRAPAAGAAVPAAPAKLKCAEMLSSNLRLAGVQITRAATVVGDPQAPSAYCLMQGRLNPRAGADGKNYAIGFELRLPLAWNGRFCIRPMAATMAALCPQTVGHSMPPITSAPWRVALLC